MSRGGGGVVEERSVEHRCIVAWQLHYHHLDTCWALGLFKKGSGKGSSHRIFSSQRISKRRRWLSWSGSASSVATTERNFPFP